MNILYNTIFVNGEAFNCSSTMSIYDLLIYLGFDINSIVVEHNSKLINTSKLPTIILLNRDKLEIVTIVGGG